MKHQIHIFLIFVLLLKAGLPASSGLSLIKNRNNAFISSRGGAFAASQLPECVLEGNPAGLGSLSNNVVSLTLTKGLAGCVNFSLDTAFRNGLSLGLKTGREGQVTDVQSTDLHSYGSFLISAAYGRKFRRLTLGMETAYLYNKRSEIKDHALIFATGLQLLAGENTSLGIDIRNFGISRLSLKDDEGQPLTLRAGLEHRISLGNFHRLLITSDLGFRTDYVPFINVGFGWRIRNIFLLNLGYDYNLNHNDELGFSSGINLGFGFNAGKVKFLSSFKPSGELGTSILFSLLFSLKIRPAP